MKIIFLMVVSLIFISCAGNKIASSSDCKSRDWTNLGVRDGKIGQDKIKDVTAVCKTATPLQQSSYRQGFAQGLTSFCTYENGKNLALKGIPAPNVCPTTLNKALMQGYNETIKAKAAKK